MKGGGGERGGSSKVVRIKEDCRTKEGRMEAMKERKNNSEKLVRRRRTRELCDLRKIAAGKKEGRFKEEKLVWKLFGEMTGDKSWRAGRRGEGGRKEWKGRKRRGRRRGRRLIFSFSFYFFSILCLSPLFRIISYFSFPHSYSSLLDTFCFSSSHLIFSFFPLPYFSSSPSFLCPHFLIPPSFYSFPVSS